MSLKNQLRAVIEWEDTDSEILFFRWTENGEEIKNASKLIVGPGQGCLFVYEGKVKDVILDEGLVDLETDNVPFWTTIKTLMQGSESHHKVGIYYFRKAEMTNVRWGTPAPIIYQDPKYNFPVGLGAYGNYSMHITEPEAFFRNIIAGAHYYGIRDIQQLILSRITPLVTEIIAQRQFSYADIDANRMLIASQVTDRVRPIFDQLGFRLNDLRIEGTNFDETTQERIGKIADMSAEAQAAAAAGIDYVQLQQLNAMKDAAKNENSTAAIGMAMNAGMGFANMVNQVMPGQAQSAAQPQMPPQQQAQPAGAVDELTQKLSKLKMLFEQGLIDESEYAAKKRKSSIKFNQSRTLKLRERIFCTCQRYFL